MDQKFASSKQNKKQIINKSNQKLNINAINFKKVSPSTHSNIQVNYDTLSVLYANEIDNIAKILSKSNSIYFFSKEKFSEIFENFKETFKNLGININFYHIKNIDEIITKTSNLNCSIALVNVLNDKNEIQFISKFLDLQKICIINFTNCNTVLNNKMSIDVDFKKNILNSLSLQEKLKIFLDCVYLSLQTKRTLDFRF